MELPSDEETEEERLERERRNCEWLCESENKEAGNLNEADGYNCKHCNNKGYIAVPHCYLKSYSVAHTPCKCVSIRKTIRALNNSGLADVVKEYTFDKYIAKESWQKTILNAAKDYLSDDKEHWFFMGGATGCVDCDTEYFNGVEWKKISEYMQGECVLQYNPFTKIGNLTRPRRYIVNPSERLYQIKTISGHIDMCLSDNHNFAYITSKGHMQKKPFSEVMKQHNNSVAGFYGKIETSFDFSGNGIDLTDNEIRIMVAVIADGHFRKDLKLCSIKVKKERKKERIRRLLQGVDYREYRYTNGYSDFRFYAPRREKEFSEYWYNCNNEQLKIIADEVFYWDGHINGKRKSYYSTSRQSADFVQFALSATGSRATLCIDNHKEKACYRVICASGSSRVSMVRSTCGAKAEIIPYVPKDGKQYCFTVDTGYLILRRNGRIFITGNSGKSHICTAVAITLLKRGKEVKYMLWRDEASRLKAMVNEPEYETIVKHYKTVDVLYIDDLFKTGKSENSRKQRPTQGDINLAFEILNARYISKKLTIISSESTLPDLIDIDEAIAGRIKQKCGDYCLNIAPDTSKNYRLK